MAIAKLKAKAKVNKASAKRKAVAKLPSLALLVPCDSISRDPNTSKVTLYGLYDAWYMKSLPDNARITALIRLIGGKGQHKVEIRVSGPNGRAIPESTGVFDVSFDPSPNVEIGFITGVLVKKYGPYTIEVYIGKKRIGDGFTISAKQFPESSNAN